MRIAAFRGEKNLGELVSKLYPDLNNLGELVSKLYPDLKSAKKKKTEEALLRANPQLSSFADLQEGALLIVPKVTDVPSKTQGETEEPAANIARTIARALDQYREQLNQASNRGIDEAQKTRKALKDEELKKKAIEGYPAFQEIAGRIDKAAEEREKESERLHAFATEELAAAQEDLAELIDRLS
jgi:hypothetical protein